MDEKIIPFPGCKDPGEEFIKKMKKEEEKLKNYRWAGPFLITMDECGIPLIAFLDAPGVDFSKAVAVVELQAPSEEEQEILWKGFVDLINRYFRFMERKRDK